MDVEYFTKKPVWTSLIHSNATHHLYLPKDFNYPDIETAILHIDHNTLKAHLYLIQVILARDHKDLEPYSDMWHA